MKLKCKFLILIGILALGGHCKAQLNLVPNPSFEDTINCIYSGLGGVNKCDKWYSCRSSPDYWTSCSQIYIVPNTVASYQFPHSGDKMFGIATYATQLAVSGLFREIPGVDLIQSTITGNKYYFSMFINQAYSSTTNVVALLATNRIGVKLTNSIYTQASPVPINNTADYYDTIFHSDTAQWVKISGSFISNGSFSKLMIGNFFNDANTDTMNLDNDSLTYQNAVSYYFIDDVCLSTDSLYAAIWTGIKENQLNPYTISLSPNPANSSITINGLISPFSEYRIIDIQGKVLQNQN
ncbi:MAG: hypothetical protein ACKOX3_08665, partial [Bacteroidota bacterium]